MWLMHLHFMQDCSGLYHNSRHLHVSALVRTLQCVDYLHVYVFVFILHIIYVHTCICIKCICIHRLSMYVHIVCGNDLLLYQFLGYVLGCSSGILYYSQ